MNSSRKGADGERELAEILRKQGYHIERGGSMSFGAAPDLRGLPGIHIEVKRVEKLNISQAMAQAVRDSKRFQDGKPAVFHRRNREAWLVTMRLEDWLNLAPLNERIRPIAEAGNIKTQPKSKGDCSASESL